MKVILEIQDKEIGDYQALLKKWQRDYETVVFTWLMKGLSEIPTTRNPNSFEPVILPNQIKIWKDNNPLSVLPPAPTLIPNV